MAAGHESQQHLPLKGIYINFEERSIEFEDTHGTVGRIVFAGERLLVEGRPLTLAAAAEESGEQREKQATVTLAGTLVTQPVQGKPDARGRGTAWARFAAHEEGQEDAHLYSAT